MWCYVWQISNQLASPANRGGDLLLLLWRGVRSNDCIRGLAPVCYRLEIPRPMPDPALEQLEDRAYFTDAAGVKWRVHDVAFGRPHAKPYHYRRFSIGDARATSRIFVGAGGMRRSYAFKKGESRELEGDRCEEQLAQAGFLGSEAFDAKSRGPR